MWKNFRYVIRSTMDASHSRMFISSVGEKLESLEWRQHKASNSLREMEATLKKQETALKNQETTLNNLNDGHHDRFYEMDLKLYEIDLLEQELEERIKTQIFPDRPNLPLKALLQIASSEFGENTRLKLTEQEMYNVQRFKKFLGDKCITLRELEDNFNFYIKKLYP